MQARMAAPASRAGPRHGRNPESRNQQNDSTRIPVPLDETPGLQVLGQIEKTVSLMLDVLASGHSPASFDLPPPENRTRTPLFIPGAFSNPEHVKFALRGCLAATLCYITYNALFWPGISTAIITCVVTALTTIGASHQKQFLRFAGVLVGGAVVGMGAQVFLLPDIDSIGAFTVLCVLVTAIAAWFATASSRLSLFRDTTCPWFLSGQFTGVQIPDIAGGCARPRGGSFAWPSDDVARL